MSRKEFIPSTKKAIQQKVSKIKKKIDTEVATNKAEGVPEDLLALWNAVTAIASTHRLLQEGSFSWHYRQMLLVSIPFIEALHKKAVQEAGEHPQAFMIKELQELLGKETKDGKSETTTNQ